MEIIGMTLGIIVSVGVIVGYVKTTLTTSVHLVVDQMFAQQKETTNRLFGEHRIALEKQLQTLDMLNRSIDKLSAVVNKLDEHQRNLEKEVAILGKDVTALHSRVDDHDERFMLFGRFCNMEHKEEMSPELLHVITNGKRRRQNHE